jgi:hypothetical protein
VDASANNTTGVEPSLFVAHTFFLAPGNYTISERSSGGDLQGQAYMSDLLGVFIFGKQ